MGGMGVLCVLGRQQIKFAARKLNYKQQAQAYASCINFWDKKSRTADGGYENYPTKLLNYRIKLISPRSSIEQISPLSSTITQPTTLTISNECRFLELISQACLMV
jgi:hypothetical protein